MPESRRVERYRAERYSAHGWIGAQPGTVSARQSAAAERECRRSPQMMNNPQMRGVVESNPELAHILNDPATLRQSLET